MEGFRPWRGGYMAKADSMERRLIAGLASDVAYMLGHPIDDMLHEREQEPGAEPDPLDAYEAELFGLDREAEHDVPDVPMDDAFYRLMPDMSEDPEEARTLRGMTAAGLAATKAEHLLTLWSSLNGPTDEVWVGNDDVAAWLGASNSIRLVVAARLGITDAETDKEVYEKSQNITGADGRGQEREIDDPNDLLAVLYTMVSWWQDSLLAAIRNKRLRG